MEIAAPPIASCSKEHQKIYQEWFACADSDGDGRLTGGDAIKFFSMSNLSRAELKQVWAIADSKRQGFLGFKEFITAMQLIGLAQSGNEISQDTLHAVAADLANLKPPVMNGLDILLAKKRSPKKSEPELDVTQPQIPSSVQWFSSKSAKKLTWMGLTSC